MSPPATPALAATSSKGAVAAVVIQPVGLSLTGDEQVEPAVIIVIGPGRRIGIDRLQQAGFGSHVGEAAIAVIAQQRGPDRVRKPSAARDEDVEAAVVVVVGLIADQAAELVGHAVPFYCGPRRCRPPCFGRTTWGGRGPSQVTARSSRPSLSKSSMIAPPDWLKRLTPTMWPTSRNLPMSNSEWKKRSSVIRYFGSTPDGILTQGHVGHVQEPADPEIIGKLLEILREVFDCETGTLGLGMNSGGGDGNNAGAFAPAHDAVVVFALAHGRDALGVDDRVEPILGLGVLKIEPGPGFFQHLVCADGVAVVIE